ncbi:MAG: BsuBI/PstI family type II restriction endonuclease [Candidatus Jettenia sp. CY-1]|nr:MAG: BsuBI/PstI family type II restriction endonuclease [Candidatus Jettenia sp. CY-1]
MTIQEIKTIFEKINFPQRFISEQTAICIMALSDKTERKGLLPNHQSLCEGARIYDILNFARNVLGKQVAENTREAYRKTSLAPLLNYGLVVRHQLSTNAPNTYYRLHPDFERLFSEKHLEKWQKLIAELRIKSTKLRERHIRKVSQHSAVCVQINGEGTFSLSPGAHNILEKAIVEVFGHAFFSKPQVVYLGDIAPRKGYQNRILMRRLNLPIDTAESLPDVILLSEHEKHLVIVEVVTSSGPINHIRLEQLQEFTLESSTLGYKSVILPPLLPVLFLEDLLKRLLGEVVYGLRMNQIILCILKSLMINEIQS